MSTRRGTTNRNDRGNTTSRRRRREWLVETYRADVDVLDETVNVAGTLFTHKRLVHHGRGEPACRCYRCGCLLTVDTVTADRIIPGIEGGTYKRSNIRPACMTCNASTGGKLGAARKACARQLGRLECTRVDVHTTHTFESSYVPDYHDLAEASGDRQ
jgi:HNH endonuclease